MNPERLALPADQLHLWLLDLEQVQEALPLWAGWLDGVERQRAEGYKFERDRLRFIAGRGLLRQLLARYTGLEPAGIRFTLNAFGKPCLPGQAIAFNLSHSRGRVACAFSAQGDLGVDLEQVIPLDDLPRMAAAWFSPREAAEFAALPPDAQTEAFYHIWTQKEACLKAQGQGLSLPLQEFSVEVDPTRPGRLVDLAGWQMHTLVPQPGWRLALCLRQASAGSALALKVFEAL